MLNLMLTTSSKLCVLVFNTQVNMQRECWGSGRCTGTAVNRGGVGKLGLVDEYNRSPTPNQRGNSNVMVGEVPNTNLLHQKTYIKLKHHYTLHDDLVARGREVRMPGSA